MSCVRLSMLCVSAFVHNQRALATHEYSNCMTHSIGHRSPLRSMVFGDMISHLRPVYRVGCTAFSSCLILYGVKGDHCSWVDGRLVVFTLKRRGRGGMATAVFCSGCREWVGHGPHRGYWCCVAVDDWVRLIVSFVVVSISISIIFLFVRVALFTFTWLVEKTRLAAFVL